MKKIYKSPNLMFVLKNSDELFTASSESVNENDNDNIGGYFDGWTDEEWAD